MVNVTGNDARKTPCNVPQVPALAGYQEFVVVLEAAVGKLLGIVGEHALGLGNVHYVPSPLLDQHQEVRGWFNTLKRPRTKGTIAIKVSLLFFSFA